MYESFYNLRGKPFSLVPDTDFLYLGATHRTALSLLEYGLISEAPFVVLTGDPGMGKTSLLQRIISENEAKFSIGFVTNARYDVEHLLPWILLSLGLSQKRLDPVEAYHIFSEFLVKESKRNRRVLLIVDEAQSLGVELLEELRLLSNMNQGKALKLQIILSGQPDLHTLLQRIDMTQFAQRVVVDYHLQPFTSEDVEGYIQHRLQIAGAKPSLFTREACRLAYRLSKGNPRLINQVCEMALTYGFAEQVRRITAKLLAQAATDRRKNGILPLAGQEDLAAILAAPEEVEEPSAIHSPSQWLTAPPREVPLPPTTTAETCYQTGLSLRRTREFKAAIEQFERAAEDATYHLKAFGQIGLCYKASGQPNQAVIAFRKALTDQSAPAKEALAVRYLLGTTLEQLQEIPEAVEHYKKISRVDPRYKDVETRLARFQRSGSHGRSLRKTARPSLLRRTIQQLQTLFKGEKKK